MESEFCVYVLESMRCPRPESGSRFVWVCTGELQRQYKTRRRLWPRLASTIIRLLPRSHHSVPSLAHVRSMIIDSPSEIEMASMRDETATGPLSL
jgi:hypothetical protein